ncbi:MAG: hypothetical protein PHN92_08185 [Geobacter sp.]|nr:hypothetical protein [Geobacter sp.]
MSLRERLKRLESAYAAKQTDWNQISIECATVLMALEAGEPWEVLSAKLSAQTVDALQLSAEVWKRYLDESKVEYEKTFGPGSCEANRARGEYE